MVNLNSAQRTDCFDQRAVLDLVSLRELIDLVFL